MYTFGLYNDFQRPADGEVCVSPFADRSGINSGGIEGMDGLGNQETGVSYTPQPTRLPTALHTTLYTIKLGAHFGNMKRPGLRTTAKI